jgi:hypothetical protein
MSFVIPLKVFGRVAVSLGIWVAGDVHWPRHDRQESDPITTARAARPTMIR